MSTIDFSPMGMDETHAECVERVAMEQAAADEMTELAAAQRARVQQDAHVLVWELRELEEACVRAEERRHTPKELIRPRRCADCGGELGNDSGPKDGWQLDDGRTVCHACCVADTKNLKI